MDMRATVPSMTADGLFAKPVATAIKGWSVCATTRASKGDMLGGTAPILVHQTLANSKEVLVCANCHRFIGTAAAQLAMVEGTHPGRNPSPGTRATHTGKGANVTNIDTGTKKRRRSEENHERDNHQEYRTNAALEIPQPPIATLHTAVNESSRRIAIAEAPASLLPALPCLRTKQEMEVRGEVRQNTESTRAEGGDNEAFRNGGGGAGGRVDRADVDGGVDAGDGAGGGLRCECGAPCDEVYCSVGCRHAAAVGGHGLICVGGHNEGSPLYEFRRFAVRTSETYLIAAKAMAAALSTAQGSKPFEELAGWREQLPNKSLSTAGESGRGAGLGGKRIRLVPEEAEEAWAMLRTGLLYGRDAHIRSVSGLAEVEKLRDQRPLSLDFFLRMVRALERHLAPITVASPLASYCKRLMQASSETKSRALPWLAPAIERAGPFGGAGESEFSAITTRSQGRELDGGGAGDNTGDLMSERGLCRLVQATSAAAGSEARSPFPPLSVVGLLHPCCTPAHSCVPNTQLEAYLAGSEGDEHRDSSGCGKVDFDGTDGGRGGSALRVGLVTLRGVSAEEEVFAPYIALGQPVDDRRQELLCSGGSAVQSSSLLCRCPRCRLEADGDRSCGPEMLKILADQALEEGRIKTALNLYGDVIAMSPSTSRKLSPRRSSGPRSNNPSQKNHGPTTLGKPGTSQAAQSESSSAKAKAITTATTQETIGDALHGVGVALLAAGKFKEACRAWERGFRDAPFHSALQAQADKEKAYRPRGKESARCKEKQQQQQQQQQQQGLPLETMSDAFGVDQGRYDGFASIDGGAPNIFMSKEPVLSREECRHVIATATEYAEANGGWTTSRHYAVPTTDLPVHVLEPVLPWFRTLLSERLLPALARNFDLAGGAGRVSVHDAFVVRYDEGRQRHLPLHRDQSTHSFTIALNDVESYDGGGTFFPCLGRALRPAEGHALSFQGNILHGGDPLLKGVRYIIACFCYHDVDGDVERGVSTDASAAAGESRRGGTTNQEKKAKDGIEFRSEEAFSFGFGFG